MKSSHKAPALHLLTVMAGAETFGLPISHIQTIFHIGAITPVPLGPPSILGLVNLRGSIIPALSLRWCLNSRGRTRARRVFGGRA